MGAWGAGLYSSDIALDLRSSIKTVVRLPFEEQRLIEITVDTFAEIANNQSDEDYTVFWLVLADQLHRRGIEAQVVFDTAIDIIESGKDLQLHRELGMVDSDLRKRQKNLEKLQTKLIQPVPQKTRTTLKKPQPLLMSVGDVIVYPIDVRGECINPYIADKDWERFPNLTWKTIDWGAAVIVACGRVFEYISYYTPIVINKRLNVNEKPSLDLLSKHSGWDLESAGTCSKIHCRRMQLEKIGSIEIDSIKLRDQFQKIDDGVSAATNDISLANRLGVFERPSFVQGPTIEYLKQIISQ